MNFLRINNLDLYLNQSKTIENRLIDVYSDSTIDNLYSLLDTYNQLVKYVEKERIRY